MLNPNNLTLIFNKFNLLQSQYSQETNRIKHKSNKSNYIFSEYIIKLFKFYKNSFLFRFFSFFWRNRIFLFLIISFFIFLFWFFSNKTLEVLNNFYFIENKNINDKNQLNNIITYTKLKPVKDWFNIFYENFNSQFYDQEIEILPSIEILEKTGRNIYSCPNTIFNFIIAILILLLALLSLFFLI